MINCSYHGLHCLSRPLSAVLLHCPLPGCSRPHPLPRRGLCSLQFLGFPRLLGAPPHLPQPGVLDLLVPGELGGADAGLAPQLRFTASFAMPNHFLVTWTGKRKQSRSYREKIFWLLRKTRHNLTLKYSTNMDMFIC